MHEDFERYAAEVSAGLVEDRKEAETGSKGNCEIQALFRPLIEFEEEEATWLVPGWIPQGQITLIAADGGVGKTSLWVDIAAAISSGRPCILDPPGHTRELQKVLFCTTEDSVKKKLRRKLRGAGADLTRVQAMDLTADKDGLLRSFKFGTAELYRVIREIRPDLCIFDPVQGFVPPDVNMGSRNAMRDCMAPLITIGEDVGTTFIVICHTNKRKGAYGRDRIADSADLWDISRSVIMLGYTDEQGQRYISNEKNNYDQLQDSVLFTINDNGQAERTGTTWKRDRDYQLEAASSKTISNVEDCSTYIIQALSEAEGPVEVKQLDSMAQSAGYSGQTIKRAKSKLKLESEIKYINKGSGRDGSKQWFAELTY